MKINKYTSHASAFISSTFVDLEMERKAVANILREFNLNINALDIKPASNDSSKKEIMAGIKESDFVILIVGERYGSIIPKMTNSDRLSITRWEYIQAAKHFKKDVLVFFKRVQLQDDKYYDNKDSSDYRIKRKLLDDFKKMLANDHSPKYFSTTDELVQEVKSALIPVYRTGVKNLLNKNDLLTKENEELRLEISRLKSSGTQNSTTRLPFGGLGLSGNQTLANLGGAIQNSIFHGDSPIGLNETRKNASGFGGGLLDSRGISEYESKPRSGLLGLGSGLLGPVKLKDK